MKLFTLLSAILIGASTFSYSNIKINQVNKDVDVFHDNHFCGDINASKKSLNHFVDNDDTTYNEQNNDPGIDKGPVYDCYGIHNVSLSGLDNNGHSNGGVTITDMSFYTNATYYYYQNSVLCMSGSCNTGDKFYIPGYYRLHIKCVCKQYYWYNFTIDSLTMSSAPAICTYGGNQINNYGYIISNDFTFEQNSPYGHVHSKLIFPPENNVSSVLIADSFNLFYAFQCNSMAFDLVEDSEITVKYNYHCVAEYGLSSTYNTYMEFDVSGQNSFDFEYVDVSDDGYKRTLSLALDYFHTKKILGDDYISRLLEVMYMTIEIDFDIVSNQYVNAYVGPIINIDAFSVIFMESYFYFDYKHDSINCTFSVYNTLMDAILDETIGNLLSSIPYVGPLLGYTHAILGAFGLLPDSTNIIQSNQDYCFHSTIRFNFGGSF